MGPEGVVDLQVEAFNRGDAVAFADTYAVDAVITNLTSDETPICGRKAIHEYYAAMFEALPDLRVSVEGRLAVGNLIIDHEHLPTLASRAVITYEVEEGLIKRVWMHGPLPA